MSSSESITLPDGRSLAYEMYGDMSGTPLVLHHGTPGSHVFGALLSETARKQGVCVVAPTRPGYGASTSNPNGTLETWADDCTILVDHLGLESFAIVGISGGGPFALQVAENLPNRVTTIGLVSSIVPGTDTNRFEMLACRHCPRLFGLALRAVAEFARYRGPEFVIRQATDEIVDTETVNIVYQDFRTALERGPTGWLQESCFFATDWSIPTPDIQIHAWHGVTDKNIPIGPVRATYAYLPNVSFSEIETDHLGVLLAVSEEVVRLAKQPKH